MQTAQSSEGFVWTQYQNMEFIEKWNSLASCVTSSFLKKTVPWIVAKRKEIYKHATRTQYFKIQLLVHRKHPASTPPTPNSMVRRETMDICAENRTKQVNVLPGGIYSNHCASDRWYRSLATAVSQLKICDFSGETFKDFEEILSAMSATTTQLLSSGEFCKLRYDTIPVKSASANVSFYTSN